MFPTVLQPQEIVIFPVASRRESKNAEGSRQTRLNSVINRSSSLEKQPYTQVSNVPTAK